MTNNYVFTFFLKLNNWLKNCIYCLYLFYHLHIWSLCRFSLYLSSKCFKNGSIRDKAEAIREDKHKKSIFFSGRTTKVLPSLLCSLTYKKKLFLCVSSLNVSVFLKVHFKVSRMLPVSRMPNLLILEVSGNLPSPPPCGNQLSLI